MTPKKAWDQVMELGGIVIDYSTEFDYENYLIKFDVVCQPWQEFVVYVKDTCLIPHKERFLKAWTNKVMHLGNQTTNKFFTYNPWSIKEVFLYNLHFFRRLCMNLSIGLRLPMGPWRGCSKLAWEFMQMLGCNEQHDYAA